MHNGGGKGAKNSVTAFMDDPLVPLDGLSARSESGFSMAFAVLVYAE